MVGNPVEEDLNTNSKPLLIMIVSRWPIDMMIGGNIPGQVRLCRPVPSDNQVAGDSRSKTNWVVHAIAGDSAILCRTGIVLPRQGMTITSTTKNGRLSKARYQSNV